MFFHPVSPPGVLVKTDSGDQAVRLEEKDIIVEVTPLKFSDGGPKSRQPPAAEVTLRIANHSSTPVTLKISGLALQVNDVPMPLIPYLTIVRVSGKHQELEDADEILMLSGNTLHIVVRLESCRPRPTCMPAGNIEHVERPINATFRIDSFELLRTKEKVAFSARFKANP